MFKNVMILSILCIFIYGVVCLAEERPPAVEDMHKLQQSKERIEKLLTMAREAEEKAKNFRLEAQELQRMTGREFEPAEGGPKPPPPEQMHARIAELKEAIQQAEREGQHDRAAQLREKIMVLTGELEGRDREGQEQKRIELKEKLSQLVKMARQAKERGEMDKAERLGAEAEELERILKTEFQQREKTMHVKELQAKLAELKKAAQLAQQQGREDEAAELREKAKQIAREIEETTPPGKIRSPKNEIERLHALAAEAKEQGRHDQADALLREAKGLESRPKGPPELKKQPPVPPELLHQIELLRDEVMRLRKDIEEIRQLVHREQ